MTRRSVSKKRVVVFSASYGGAAHGAAQSIAAYYRERCAETVDVTIVDPVEQFMPNVNVLAKFAYQQASEFFPAGYGDVADMARQDPKNQVITALTIGGLAQVREYLTRQPADLVVSTSPIAAGIAAELSAQLPFSAVSVVADYDTRDSWIHPRTELFCVSCRDVRDELAVAGTPWDRIVVSGIPVAEKFATGGTGAGLRSYLGIADRFTALLLATSSPQVDSDDMASQLAAAGIQVMAAAGASARVQRRLMAVSEKTGLVRVFGFTEEMPALMRGSDVLVAHAGGIALAESLAVGLPLVILGPVPSGETHNVDALVHNGAALLSRDETDAVEKVKFLSTHPDRLTQMVANAGTLGRPDAVQTLCERVLASVR